MFILLRALDILTTLRFPSLEANPLYSFIFTSYGTVGFLILNISLSLIIYVLLTVFYKIKVIKVTYWGFIVLNTIVVINNLIVLWLN